MLRPGCRMSWWSRYSVTIPGPDQVRVAGRARGRDPPFSALVPADRVRARTCVGQCAVLFSLTGILRAALATTASTSHLGDSITPLWTRRCRGCGRRPQTVRSEIVVT